MSSSVYISDITYNDCSMSYYIVYIQSGQLQEVQIKILIGTSASIGHQWSLTITVMDFRCNMQLFYFDTAGLGASDKISPPSLSLTASTEVSRMRINSQYLRELTKGKFLIKYSQLSLTESIGQGTLYSIVSRYCYNYIDVTSSARRVWCCVQS